MKKIPVRHKRVEHHVEGGRLLSKGKWIWEKRREKKSWIVVDERARRDAGERSMRNRRTGEGRSVDWPKCGSEKEMKGRKEEREKVTRWWERGREGQLARIVGFGRKEERGRVG